MGAERTTTSGSGSWACSTGHEGRLSSVSDVGHDGRGPDPLLGISAIARRLGMSRQRVFVLADRDDFPRPAYKLETGRLWHVTDVEKWIARNSRYDHSGDKVDE
jgi:predicted DNA-binding transcriptional regulator AlpA